MVLAKSRHHKTERTFTDAEWSMLERDGHAKNFEFLRRFTPAQPPETRQAKSRETQKEKAPADKPEKPDHSI
jgi:hypothetical protein